MKKKRSSGQYMTNIYLGKSTDGKKRYKSVYARSQKELDAKVTDIRIKLGKGIDVTAERDTFDFWGRKWLKFRRGEVSESWYDKLCSYYKKLAPIYQSPVSKLRALDIREILTELAIQGYSKRTVKAVYNISNGVMQLAVENRVIDSNPFRDQKIGGKAAKERRALTKEEQKWVIDTPHYARTAAMIMMFSGLRRGELIPLTWSDIDFVNCTITVNKSVEMDGNVSRLKQGGKTDSAMRVVFVPNVLIKYLKEQERKALFVCPTKSGKMHTNSSWRNMWDDYIMTLNAKYADFGTQKEETEKLKPRERPILIPKFTAHWLRHTFITNMYLAGVDVLTAKEQAGHADIQTTLGIYAHLDGEYKRKNVDKLNEYINENFG